MKYLIKIVIYLSEQHKLTQLVFQSTIENNVQ